MKRYSDTKIKIDKDGKRVYSSTYYPGIPLENSDILCESSKESLALLPSFI